MSFWLMVYNILERVPCWCVVHGDCNQRGCKKNSARGLVFYPRKTPKLSVYGSVWGDQLMEVVEWRDVGIGVKLVVWKCELQLTAQRLNSLTKSRQKSWEFSSLLFTVSSTALPLDFYFFKLTQSLRVSVKDALLLDLIWFKKSIQKPQVWELSTLCSETSMKLYVHEFGLRTNDLSCTFLGYSLIVQAWPPSMLVSCIF